MKLIRYISLLRTFVVMSQMSAVEHRVDYILRYVRAFVEIGTAFLIISVFYSHTTSIAGWNHWEALVVYGLFQGISSLVFAFFGFGIDSLSSNIVNGRLDNFLTKPLDAQFLSCVTYTFITNFFRSAFGFGVVFYALIKMGYTIVPVNLFLGIIALFSAMVIFYCLTFLASETAFWTQSFEFNELSYTIMSVSRFPVDYFNKLKRAMYLLPLAFIATVPAQALLGRGYIPALLSPLIAVALFWLARKVWFAGLRSYQSVSS